MDVRAVAKDVRISPIKLRLTADLIRNKSVNEGLAILNNLSNKQARLIKKVLESATANAVNNNKLNQDKLMIKEVRIDMARTYKRMVPDSRGRIAQNFHRHSHITIVVSEKE
ncbi:MAG TPA: 50S ribosomal protein L22 [Bacilli bacterium]|nr:50S ribosomal protein L22 [Bacilli bacterium]